MRILTPALVSLLALSSLFATPAWLIPATSGAKARLATSSFTLRSGEGGGEDGGDSGGDDDDDDEDFRVLG